MYAVYSGDVLSFKPFEGAFFNAVTILIALLALVASIMGGTYARRALSQPKRQIDVIVKRSVPLLSYEATDMAVVYEGATLASPYLLTLTIRNHSRHDVSRANFDGQPVHVSLGALTRKVISFTSSPVEAADLLNCTLTEGGLEVGPMTVKRRTSYDLEILVDGTPFVGCTDTLVDANVKTLVGGSFERTLRPWYESLWPGVVLLISALAMGTFVYFVKAEASNSFNDKKSRSPEVPAQVGGVEKPELSVLYDKSGGVLLVGSSFKGYKSVEVSLDCKSGVVPRRVRVEVNSGGEFKLVVGILQDAKMALRVCSAQAMRLDTGHMIAEINDFPLR